jgi:4-azaleucine resistance transporter AzlC
MMEGVMRLQALKAAFPKTLPVMAGYVFLAIGFGILLGKAGLGAGWAMLMSGGIYAGAMQYVTIDLFLSATTLWESALMTLMVNARHLFYGISMAGKYQNTGKMKPYLALSLTDETYALLAGESAPDGVDSRWYYFFVSLLNQLYWVLGSVLGSLIGSALPFDMTGIDFAMTALFVVIFVEHWQKKTARIPALIGLFCAVVCLMLFGPMGFTVPAMVLMCGMLLLMRGRLSNNAKEGR